MIQPNLFPFGRVRFCFQHFLRQLVYIFSFHVVYKSVCVCIYSLTVPTGSNKISSPSTIYLCGHIRYNQFSYSNLFLTIQMSTLKIKAKCRFQISVSPYKTLRYHYPDDHNPNVWSVHMNVSYSFVYLFVLGFFKFL
jgi:hypothetical protein